MWKSERLAILSPQSLHGRPSPSFAKLAVPDRFGGWGHDVYQQSVRYYIYASINHSIHQKTALSYNAVTEVLIDEPFIILKHPELRA